MKSDLNKHIEKQINKTLNLNAVFTWKKVGGGSINNAYKLTSKAQSFFVKTNTISIFKNGFKEEVHGLNFLKTNGVSIPQIIVEGTFNTEIYLVLSWVENYYETNKFWQNFAVQLADLHKNKSVQFGLNHNNFMGQLFQKNTFFNDFPSFFIENRLKPQVKIAFDNGLLQTKEVQLFESLYKQLGTIIPAEKPSAIHGDLWSGNFIAAINNKAVFIDPAVCYGHREVDLAMSLLFGGFSNEFYTTYNEVVPLEKGFNTRKDIYNLYPLLIHLNLFGTSYLKSIKTIVSQF
ncbi:fructosamine kinase family protein [Lutibacter sp. A64]|uniref:fructosamine kinase family protein n=1 Tax=Lutibacter sp. A64 TaxID=2918526 RepID=UPI001F0644BD|nr:fructosamine kinase family protein [Lutibacter sp. A64]UMB53097.1 fructosamine kinase family protein [Lutibacter sp. A64]